MIVYTPFWKTLKESNESTYTLIHQHHFSASFIQRLRDNKPISTNSVNDLCRILNCTPNDIMEYVSNDKDQTL